MVGGNVRVEGGERNEGMNEKRQERRVWMGTAWWRETGQNSGNRLRNIISTASSLCIYHEKHVSYGI